MLGKLAPAGADDAVIGDSDKIRHAAVVERILVEPSQFVAVEQFLDVQLSCVGQDVGLGIRIVGMAGRRIGRLLQFRRQPDQRLVVADLEAVGAEARSAAIQRSEIATRSLTLIGD